MKALELKKQQMYLSVLRKRGQVVKLPGGGEEIVSFPDAKVVTPNTLKDKLLKNWTLDERIWANVWVFFRASLLTKCHSFGEFGSLLILNWQKTALKHDVSILLIPAVHITDGRMKTTMRNAANCRSSSTTCSIRRRTRSKWSASFLTRVRETLGWDISSKAFLESSPEVSTTIKVLNGKVRGKRRFSI